MPVSGKGRRAQGLGRLERSPQRRWWWLPLVAASLLLLGPQAGRALGLAAGEGVELVGTDGQAVRRWLGVSLYLKESPAAIRNCGGIGTWPKPAAQLGASFVNDGTLVVDPFSQRLWFRGPLTPTRRP